MKNRTILGKIVIEELKKHDKTVPSRRIAKIIMTQFPELFSNIERTRKIVRYYRGNCGADALKSRINDDANAELVRENRTAKRAIAEFDLKSTPVGVEDYIFQHKKPVILSDIHLPFHSVESLDKALDKAIAKNCDSIYLNGDTLDCSKISSFVPDPEASDFSRERDMFWQLLEYLQSTNLPVTFKEGNHEFRLTYHLRKQNPELAKLEDFTTDRILHLADFDVDYVSSLQKTRMGKLLVIHGHEFGSSVFSPVNPARGLFLRAKCSVIAGHYHQTSQHHESNLKGDPMACFSTGCLCTLTPTWRPFAFTKWNHGFAVVEIEDDGGFFVDNYRIIDGKIR